MYQTGFKSQLFHLNPSKSLTSFSSHFVPYKTGDSKSTCLAEKRKESDGINACEELRTGLGTAGRPWP